MLPCLRRLFPDPKTIASSLGSGAEPAAVSVASLLKALEPSMRAVLGGSRILARLEEQLRDPAIALKGGCCDLDRALAAHVLCVWQYADAMRAFRRRHAVNTLQHWYRKKWSPGDDEPAGSELPELPAFDAPPSPERAEAEEGAAGDGGDGDEAAPPASATSPRASPRVRERLEQAKALDAETNGPSAPAS